MALYSLSSQEKLDSVHQDLVLIFQEVIKVFDNTILYGYRSPEEQFELFKKGRNNIAGHWIITNKKEVITFKDGYIAKSKHNFSPSLAIDATPYPIDWNDIKRIHYFAVWVMATAERLKQEGKITNKITWGGDWNRNTQVKDETFMDLCHFEIK